jgi:hypothetical protein
MAIKFFHTPKNKQFKFKPRYYDEQKEELDKRVEQIKKEMGISDDNDDKKPYVSTIRRGEMRGYLKKNVERKRKSTIRLVIILLVLFAIVYYLLYF